MATEIPSPQNWKDTFPLEELPESIRKTFSGLLIHRAINARIYSEIPPDKFDTGIGKGDSPRKELIHQIRHAKAHAKALFTGVLLPSNEWKGLTDNYSPGLEEQSQQHLVDFLKQDLDNLYTLLGLPDSNYTARIITQPWGLPISGATLIENMKEHEILHVGINMQFVNRDNLPRSPEMKARWG